MSRDLRCKSCGQRDDAYAEGWDEGKRSVLRVWDEQLHHLGGTVTTPRAYGPEGSYYLTLRHDAEDRLKRHGLIPPDA